MPGLHQHYMEMVDEVIKITSNAHLNNHFLNLNRDLDNFELKTPEDVYKMHLVNVRMFGGGTVVSTRQNITSSFVNVFVNVTLCVPYIPEPDNTNL
jgi:26S proteasome regulatory subunit N1